MDEGTGILPGLPPVAGKPVHLAFDGGLMTSDAGILLLAALERGWESPSDWPIALRTHARRNGYGTR